MRALERLLPVSLAASFVASSASPLGASPGPRDEVATLRGEVSRLRDEVAALEGQKRRFEKREQEIDESMKAVREDLGQLKERVTAPVSGPFLTAPPAPSDVIGVSKVAVFAPRLEAEAQRRRDIVFLKLRRVEADSVRLVAELELAADQPGVDLPIDRSGALYLVEWTTSDGNAYGLELKDGASAQIVAAVQIKQLQSQGRFLFVGYRVE
jgi:hypothetical protein